MSQQTPLSPDGISSGAFDRFRASQSHVNDVEVIPRVDVSVWPVSERGSIVYNVSDSLLYLSDGTHWKQVGGGSGGGGGEVTSINDAAAVGVPVIDAADPNVTLKTLVAGNNIDITDNTTSITVGIDASSVATTLASAAPADASLVVDGTGPALQMRGLTAGSGYSLSPSGGAVTVGCDVALSDAAGFSGSSAIASASSPWALKSLAALDPALSVTSSADTVSIANNTVLTEGAIAGHSLISSGSNPWATKGLIAGSGYTFALINGNVSVTALKPLYSIRNTYTTPIKIPANGMLVIQGVFSATNPTFMPIDTTSAVCSTSIEALPAGLLMRATVVSQTEIDATLINITSSDIQLSNFLAVFMVLGF